MIHFLAAMAAARRVRHGTPRASRPSLARLVFEEIGWAARQALHPVKMGMAAAVALGVGLLLGPTTPGPVLGAGWRLAVAVTLGFVALAIAHQLLVGRRAKHGPVRDVIRTVVASTLVLIVGTFVLAYLLAAVAGTPAGQQSGGLDASLPVDGPVLVAALLLLSAVLMAAFSRRLQIPGALLFLGLGMLAGDDGFAIVRLSDPDLVQTIGVLALVVVLFDGGLRTTPTDLRQGLGPGLALATLGVGVTAGVVAVGATVLLDVPARVAWLLGAIVASTDATAVLAVLRRSPLPRRLSSTLQIESGANDPVAVLLTVGLLAAWDAPPTASSWLAFGATQLIGGVLVGLVVGVAGGALLRVLRLETAGLYPVVGLGLAGLAYGGAAAMGASGFFAVFIAGATLGVEAPRRRVALRAFLDTLSSGVEVGLFLLLGLLVFPSELPGVAAVSLGVAAILVFVARPVAASVSLAWFDFDPREVAALSWLGMRGAVPIVLATLAYSAGLAEANVVFNVVFYVVVLSMLVQGIGAPYVLRRIGVATPEMDLETIAEILPVDGVGIDVVEVVVGQASPLVGGTLEAGRPPSDILVVAVIRGDEVLVPRGGTILRSGDRLVTTTADLVHGPARVERWVRGSAPRRR